MNDDARTALIAAGFDLVHAFDPARVAAEPGLAHLADPMRPLGWLIGNSRALWPRFDRARRDDPTIAAADHPLDRYTEMSVGRAFADTGARLWFGHERYDGAFLPMQRLAVAAGVGALAPTGLVIHRELGSWFALRAVAIVAGRPVAQEPASLPCTCGEACTSALSRAREARGPEAWRAWLAVRDACPVGRAHRYGDDQLLYHYGRNRDRLG
jgi:methylmalonic aciduria homocystinuria type C protein